MSNRNQNITFFFLFDNEKKFVITKNKQKNAVVVPLFKNWLTKLSSFYIKSCYLEGPPRLPRMRLSVVPGFIGWHDSVDSMDVGSWNGAVALAFERCQVVSVVSASFRFGAFTAAGVVQSIIGRYSWSSSFAAFEDICTTFVAFHTLSTYNRDDDEPLYSIICFDFKNSGWDIVQRRGLR